MKSDGCQPRAPWTRMFNIRLLNKLLIVNGVLLLWAIGLPKRSMGFHYICPVETVHPSERVAGSGRKFKRLAPCVAQGTTEEHTRQVLTRTSSALFDKEVAITQVGTLVETSGFCRKALALSADHQQLDEPRSKRPSAEEPSAVLMRAINEHCSEEKYGSRLCASVDMVINQNDGV